MKPVRVLLADDHQIVRQGARALLEPDARFEVVGEAATGKEALRLVALLRPDVVLLDLRMPDGGPDLCRRICRESPESAVLILTAFIDWSLVDACLKAGARGYLVKSTECLHLPEQLLAVAQGRRALDVSAADVIACRISRGGIPAAVLTECETRVLVLMSQGLTNREIADELVLSENTIKSHVKSILLKLDARNRLSAVLAARDLGIV